ncbi:UDP-galactose transporter senju [Chironomus tepperi]|uniref:UDP-galactose transporter senju n=1 Tax=Chironomus tepperi TaxID=113505 RepID=UPI00391EEA07
MGKTNWKELFPTRTSVFIFIAYMSLFVAQGIFVTASQEKNNSYKYDTVTLVLLTEALKLIVSCILYCRENTAQSLVTNVIKGSNVLMLYLVPAALYCLYNNLAFHNLSVFDPTTYYLLLQFRVVITGILFQIIFKKYLSRKQWISLILLTLGCMIKQVNFGDQAISNGSKNEQDEAIISKNTVGFDLSINAVFILIQTICSCLAGVYNEYLLKNTGQDINIYIQNVFMYLDSILCNALILLVQGNILSAFNIENLAEIFRPHVFIIMVNSCAVGIITSFFLKYLNSILKTFASALELVFTAVLCRMFFSIPIYINTILSIAIVSISVYLYSQSPVVNLPKSDASAKRDFEDRRALLTEEDEDDILQMNEVIIKKS